MNKRYLSFAIIPAVLLAVLLVVGGCGGEARDPQQALTDAARYARQAGSAHAQMNVTISPLEGESGMGLNIQGDAWLDMDASMFEARFTVMGMELSMRYVDGTAYLQFGGSWYVLEGDVIEGVDEGTLAAIVEVLNDVPDIISSSTEVKELGDNKVGDYECTNLEVVPDIQAIAALDSVGKLAVELDMTQEEIVAYLEDADMVIEVCVQKDESIAREVYLAANIELPSVGELVGIDLLPQNARVEVRIDFPEYGMEVEVQPPADAEPFEGL